MDFKYESQGTNTYLVYEIKAEDKIDSMSLGMLTNNKIVGFAPTFFTQMDANKFIKYNVTSKISVKQFFSGPVNKKRLLGVFEGVVDGLLSAEDYMIDPNSIILDLDYIFADVSSCEASLVCLPILENRETDISMFFKNIMFSTQFDQTENCDHVAKIINFLNSSTVISLVDFKKLLESIKNTTDPASITKVPPISSTQSEQSQQVQPKVTTVEKIQPAESGNNIAKATMPANMPPNQAKVATTASVQHVDNVKTAQVDSGKKMSMFELLMHYNKENVEIYKAQQAAKKTKTQAATNKNHVSKQPTNKGITPGFAIPGQAASVSDIQPATQPTSQQTPSQTQKAVTPTGGQQPAFTPRQVPQEQMANFGETTSLGGGAIGETTVLNAINNPAQMITPHLIRKKNNEKISLNKPVFRVGKERSYVDYFIGDNTAISRSHANFIIREGEYFVIDTNSTNHTFVNGIMIQSNVETAITHGDIIRLANEDFEFRLY